MKVLIATSKRPANLEKAVLTNEAIRAWGTDVGITIGPIIWTGGFGCNNLAFDANGGDAVQGEDLDNLISQLTYQFMPSKWCVTDDDMPTEDTYDLTDM